MARHRQLWLLIAAAGCAAAAAFVYAAVAFSSRLQAVDAAADHGFIGLRRPALEPFAQAVSHSVNPVPLVLTTSVEGPLREGGELADLAPTVLRMLGLKPPRAMTGKDLSNDPNGS